MRNARELRFSRLGRAALFVTIVSVVAACDSTGPDRLQSPEFGSVSVLVRGKAWSSRPDSDSVVLRYDSSSTLLYVGAHTEVDGHYQGLSLSACKPLEERTYAFAYTPNGPYGYVAMQLGVIGTLWEGRVLLSEYMSHGDADDAFTIEELDIPQSRVRGRFRFRAYKQSGGQVADIEGRFYGRLAFSTMPCSAFQITR